MTAFNMDGKPLLKNDEVSIVGLIVSVSGFASGVSWVTVQPVLANTPFQANVEDIRVPQNQVLGGPTYGLLPAVGSDCTTMGYATAVSGNGLAANVTVTLKQSGVSVTVHAGSCHSDNSGGSY